MDVRRWELQAGGVGGGEDTGDPWLAGYTRPRHEFRVRDYWQSQGYDTFLASHKSWHRWSDRKRLLDVPLFPSYVFVRLGQRQRARAAQAPGFLWFVRNQFGPVCVNERELEGVRILLRSGLAFDAAPTVSVGDEVEVIAGPLKGCRGYLQRKDAAAVVLCVAAIQGTIRVQLPNPRWVARLRPARDWGCNSQLAMVMALPGGVE